MIKRLLLLLIRFYRRFLSPMHAPCCPFTPTCSTYAMKAIEEHGALKGGYLAVRRLLRCQPFYKGSFYDPGSAQTGRKGKTEITGQKSRLSRFTGASLEAGHIDQKLIFLMQGGRSVHEFPQFAAADAH